MITEETVSHLAKLSRLRFTEEELASYSGDLESIFQYAQSLNELDTENLAPSAHAVPLNNVFKEDRVVTFQNIEGMLAIAPLLEEHSFVVPRILAE